MNQDLPRIIDGICREKNIDRESFIADLENAIASAVRRAYGEMEEVEVHLDMLNGQIAATINGEPIDMATLGRIAAQTAKQVIVQKTRERERTSIFEEFTERKGTIVTGTVVRAERGNLLVNLSRTEGFLPRSEQIPGETHPVGARIRVLILDVREQGNQVKVVLSRSHPDLIQRLFELEVPEVAERIIEIRALAREAGYRSKVAVTSIDSKVDAVGACVGVRGSRIKNIVDELSGEKIDIVRWNESSQILIQNSLKPAEVQEIALCFELNKAIVVVTEDQLSLAIGKRGQNVRLAARLTKWDIDILTPAEYNRNLETMEKTVKGVEGVDDLVVDKLVAVGCVSVADIDEVGPEPLVAELELDPELAERIVVECGEEAIRQEELKEAAQKKAAEEAAAARELEESAPSTPSAFVPTEGIPTATPADSPSDSADAAVPVTATSEAEAGAESAAVTTPAAEPDAEVPEGSAPTDLIAGSTVPGDTSDEPPADDTPATEGVTANSDEPPATDETKPADS